MPASYSPAQPITCSLRFRCAPATLDQSLVDAGVRVLFDDRRCISPGVKFADAELLGVPTTLIVGRGLADGVVELRDRRSGQSRNVPLASVTAALR